MPFEALEGRIITLEMEGKIVSKKFNNVDSFYISEEEVSEVMPRTPEPDIHPDTEEIMELKSFVLELFHKANINSRYSLPTPSGDNNRELVKTLFDQIEYSQKE